MKINSKLFIWRCLSLINYCINRQGRVILPVNVFIDKEHNRGQLTEDRGHLNFIFTKVKTSLILNSQFSTLNPKKPRRKIHVKNYRIWRN